MDHLIRCAQETSDAFQYKDNVVAVFIDLRQAYDRVWRQGLFYKMQKLGIAGRMYSWIKNFLSCRTIQTSCDNKISSQRTLEEGLPQGSALSCTLFLLFMNDLPDVISCQKALYADDLLIWSKGSDMRALNQAINADLTTISSYCQLWKI